MTRQRFERPSPPVDIADRAAALFRLPDVIEQLREEEVYRTGSRNARTLVHDERLTAVLIAAKCGTRTEEHATDQPTLLVDVAGEVEIRGAGGAVIHLAPASAAVLAPGVEHELAATTDCAYLLVMGGATST